MEEQLCMHKSLEADLKRIELTRQLIFYYDLSGDTDEEHCRRRDLSNVSLGIMELDASSKKLLCTCMRKGEMTDRDKKNIADVLEYIRLVAGGIEQFTKELVWDSDEDFEM